MPLKLNTTSIATPSAWRLNTGTAWVTPAAFYQLQLVPPARPSGYVGAWNPAPEDYVPGWVYLGAASAPAQTPAAGTLTMANYVSHASWAAFPSGSVEANTWKTIVDYYDAANGGVVASATLNPGISGHTRNWGSGSEGLSIRFTLRWQNESGTSPASPYSNTVMVAI